MSVFIGEGEYEDNYVLLRCGGPYENFGYNHMEFMIQSFISLSKIDRDYGNKVAPGSIARTAGYELIFEKDLNGEWVQCVAGSSDGGDEPITK